MANATAKRDFAMMMGKGTVDDHDEKGYFEDPTRDNAPVYKYCANLRHRHKEPREQGRRTVSTASERPTQGASPATCGAAPENAARGTTPTSAAPRLAHAQQRPAEQALVPVGTAETANKRAEELVEHNQEGKRAF